MAENEKGCCAGFAKKLKALLESCCSCCKTK